MSVTTGKQNFDSNPQINSRTIGLCLWNKITSVGPEFLRSITLSSGNQGTAINPMSGRQYMTEIFGPCGLGWGYSSSEWNQRGSHLFAKITLWYRPYYLSEAFDFDVKCEVEEWGGTPMAKGQDDVYKMTLTDGLSRCFMALGHGAAIYAGLMDSKYPLTPQPAAQPQGDTEPAPADQQLAEGEFAQKANDNLAASAKFDDMVDNFFHQLCEANPILNSCKSFKDAENVYFTIEKGCENEQEYVTFGFKTPGNKPNILCVKFPIPVDFFQKSQGEEQARVQ